MTVVLRDVGRRAVRTALAAFATITAFARTTGIATAAAFVTLVTLLPWTLARAVLPRAPLWTVRRLGSRLSRRVPNALVPAPLRVFPPPDREYLGVWEVPPAEARGRLLDRHGFDPQVRAYLQAYERDGATVYEAASCAYRPGGFLGPWQLHVRLFARVDGDTDVWCHWERNPDVAPMAHLRKDGYDPLKGKRLFREIVSEVRFES